MFTKALKRAVCILGAAGLFIACSSAGLTAQDEIKSLVLHDALDEIGDSNKALGAKVVNGLIKMGIKVTPGARGPGYHVKDIWPNERGTVIFWTRGDPLTLEYNAGFRLLNIWGSSGWCTLYKWLNLFGVLSRTKRGPENKEADSTLMLPGVKWWDIGNYYNLWHQWAVTWDGPPQDESPGRKAKLYLDGTQIVTNEDFHFPLGVSDIQLGSELQEGKSIIFDELSVFNRPLSGVELRRMWYETLRPLLPQLVTAPHGVSEVEIDGHLAPEEWQSSALITGLVRGNVLISKEKKLQGDGLLSQTQSHFFVQYNKDFLYIGCESFWPEEIKNKINLTAGTTGFLSSIATSRDSNLYNDDCIVVDLVPQYPYGKIYRLMVNAKDTIYDAILDPATGKIDKGWNPDWKVANKWDAESWVVEMAIPLSAFGKDITISGTDWGINMVRVWNAVKKESNAWAWGLNWAEKIDETIFAGSGKPVVLHGSSLEQWQDVLVPIGQIRFGEKHLPCIRVEQFGKLPDGHLDFRAKLLNPGQPGVTGKPLKVKAKLESDTGEINYQEEIEIPYQGSVVFEKKQDLANYNTSDVSFTVVESDVQVHRSHIGFLRQLGLEVYPHFYYSKDILLLQIEAGFLFDVPADKISAKIAIQADRTPVLTKEVPHFKSHQEPVELSTAKLTPGVYRALVTISAIGRKAHEITFQFEKPKRPEWWDNKIGISEKVPAPFTEMKVDGDKIEVWGRVYDFGDRLYPIQISTQERPMLRSPMRVVIEAPDGKILTSDELKAKSKWTMSKPNRVEGVREVKIGEYQLINSFWMEYDGFVWSTLQVEGPELAGLSLEIPFTLEFTDLQNTCDYGLKETGLLKPEGWSGSFRPVWLGNATGGLQWVAATDAGWNVKDRDKEVILRRLPEGATMVTNFVSRLTPLKPGLEIPFGFVATPVKDSTMPEKVAWNYSWYPKGQAFRPGAEGWYDPKTWGEFIQLGPRKDLATSPYIVQAPDLKQYSGPYVCTAVVDPRMQDFQIFGDEWMPNVIWGRLPIALPSDSEPYVTVCQDSKSYQDWLVWRYWKLFQSNQFAALYYDVSGEVIGNNPYNDSGYRRREGTLASASAILGNREITKRLYTMIKLRYPDAVIRFHNSGQPNMVFMAFADEFFDGENTFTHMITQKGSYIGVVDTAKYRAEIMGSNFGLRNDFLPQYTRSGVWTYETMRKAGPDDVDWLNGLTLLHRGMLAPSYFPWEFELRQTLALRRHHWGNQYKMIPYWNQKIVQLPENMYATFYRDESQDKVICVFLNESNFEGEVRLAIKWQELGFENPEGIKASAEGHENVKLVAKGKYWHEERFEFSPHPQDYARLEDGKLIFHLKPFNYRMVILEQEP